MTAIDIRTANEVDCTLILKFIRQLAEYENALDQVIATEDNLRDALFGKDPKAFALICTVDGLPAGLAIYFFSFSTWLGKMASFLKTSMFHPNTGEAVRAKLC